MGALMAIFPLGEIGGLGVLEFLLLHQVGPLAMGFGLGLLGLHRWLFPDSEVAGRRGLIAGLLSPVAMLGAGLLTRILGMVPLPQPALVSFLVGIFMALVLFFPWLSPTPEEKRSDRYEPDQLGELPSG
jgi:membrane associated rhomboid family serine protease